MLDAARFHGKWWFGACGAALALGGCDVLGSIGEPPQGADAGNSGSPGSAGSAGRMGVAGSISIPIAGSGSQTPAIPTDTREPIRAARRPPPISGGTLIALSDGERAVMSDPDRDRLVVANYRGMFLEAVIELDPGAEPARLVEDAAGRVHALLRGMGEVVTLEAPFDAIARRRSVCGAPRGLAFDAASERLIVACAEGKLVELPAGDGPIARTTEIDVDLRDVVVNGDGLFVTRFRSAELLALDAERAVIERRSLPITSNAGPLGESVLFDSAVAYRAVAGGDGSLVIVHQRALRDVIRLDVIADPPSRDGLPIVPNPAAQQENVGRTSAAIGLGRRGRFGAYGGGNGCGGVVHSAVTVRSADGALVTSPELAAMTLPVDVAVSARGLVAVAAAAPIDALAPEGAAVVAFSLGTYALADLDLGRLGNACLQPSTPQLLDQSVVIAVAFDRSGDALLAQTREPAELRIFDLSNMAALRTLPLGGDSVFDTGHDLFHRDAGAGIACASCHPEGTEDGHVWNFSDVGPRRTQPLDVGLSGTAPFHWDGSLGDMTALMDEVFTRRMAGPFESPARVRALEDYVLGFTPRAPRRAADDPAAVRGETLFESDAVGCAVCHSGEKLSNNQTMSIGKGLPTQVPSLLGVGYRAPVMHDGCAATLRDRFDPVCGGTQHGDLSRLAGSDIDDLVAYLESL